MEGEEKILYMGQGDILKRFNPKTSEDDDVGRGHGSKRDNPYYCMLTTFHNNLTRLSQM